MNRIAARLIILCSLIVPSLIAGTSPKVIHAVRTDHPPSLNGMANDSEWQVATPVMDFTQFDPEQGKPPTELTSVRILYDNRALYVGVICYDSRPERIVRQLTRRDRTTEADRFTVMVDSYHDRQTAFVFSTNVSGVQSDGVLSQDGNVYDDTWDAVWTVKTRVYRDGWSAEFEIPYNALRFAERPDGVYQWGINFRRYISRKKETDEWVMVPRGERLLIAQWGDVDGIKDISPPLHLELLPYVSGSATFQTATATEPRSSDTKALGGLDLKYGLARNFTLDGTVNPDFGQVEVDQAVLNLTVFEVRYPEKRPFFVEGAQVFTFGSSVDNTPLSLFFSRRIGKQPTGSPSVVAPPGGSVESNPEVTTILGAAKITGRSNSGFSLGMVAAATDEETATIKDSLGNTSSFVTEPRGYYNVLRIKQEFGKSWIGGMATLVSRKSTLPAGSGGVDWNLRLDDGAYTVDGYVAGAHSSSTMNPDGAAGRLIAGRIKSDHWFYYASYDFYTRYFNCNDVGFFAQPHDRGGYVQVLYDEFFAGGPLLRYEFSLLPDARWNWDGIQTRANIEGAFSTDLTNFWHVGIVYDYRLPAYDDAERGIIGLYRRPKGHAVQLQVTSDPRKDISGTLSVGYELNDQRKRSVTGSLSLVARPASWMELQPMALYQRTRREEAGVFSGGIIVSAPYAGSTYSLFGDRDLDELDGALRGIVTFTRELSLQFYLQELLARGRYQNYRLLIGGSEFVDQPIPVPAYDFNEIVFNANVLLRWEFLPGSALYLVWTQGRTDFANDYTVGFPRRFSDTFLLPHQDVLLLKVSYWIPV